MIAETIMQMLVYFACVLRVVTAYIIIIKPVKNRPRLNIGATVLFTECPRSLRAFLCQLNQGAYKIEIAIETYVTKGAIMPNNA